MQVVVRALAVLSCLADTPQGLTLPQLHKRLEIPLASVYRIAATLEHEGFIVRAASSKRYTLGRAARRLGTVHEYTAQLVAPPAPLLDLASATHETVFLTQLVDSKVVCVALVESPRPLRLFVRVGQEMPLHAAASARAILAFRDPALVDALLATYPKDLYTAGTPRDADAVIDHLAVVRERGFDICDNELDDGVWAVGAPVHDGSGRVEYGVALAAASTRMVDPESRAAAVAEVLKAAASFSAELGAKNDVRIPSKREIIARLVGRVLESGAS